MSKRKGKKTQSLEKADKLMREMMGPSDRINLSLSSLDRSDFKEEEPVAADKASEQVNVVVDMLDFQAVEMGSTDFF